jgi:hypothetical protein
MRTRKENIEAKRKKKELFITIFRISIQRVYYNDAFTPYDAQSLNPYASFRIIIAEMKNAQEAERERERRKMVLGDKLG